MLTDKQYTRCTRRAIGYRYVVVTEMFASGAPCDDVAKLCRSRATSTAILPFDVEKYVKSLALLINGTDNHCPYGLIVRTVY